MITRQNDLFLNAVQKSSEGEKSPICVISQIDTFAPPCTAVGDPQNRQPK